MFRQPLRLFHEALSLRRLLGADAPSFAQILADREGDLSLPRLQIVGLAGPSGDGEPVCSWDGCDGGDVREVGLGGGGCVAAAPLRE